MSTSLKVVSIAAVLLRLDQPPRDRRAALRHAHALFGAIAGARGRRLARRRRLAAPAVRRPAAAPRPARRLPIARHPRCVTRGAVGFDAGQLDVCSRAACAPTASRRRRGRCVCASASPRLAAAGCACGACSRGAAGAVAAVAAPSRLRRSIAQHVADLHVRAVLVRDLSRARRPAAPRPRRRPCRSRARRAARRRRRGRLPSSATCATRASTIDSPTSGTTMFDRHQALTSLRAPVDGSTVVTCLASNACVDERAPDSARAARRSFRRARAARRARARAAGASPTSSSSSGRTKSHAPMFSGSSCTQTTSSSAGIALEHAAHVAHRQRIELLDAADRDARRRGARARSSADRRAILPLQSTSAPHVARPRRARPRRRSPAASGLRPARAASTRRADGAAGSSASGRRAAADRSSSSAACRRSRWKYCAAVVQLATRMLMSAASCRKRSGRALAWSGPLPFVAVRQQQHERRLLAPLRARRQHELVEHHLRAVDEVAVLRFPDHEPLGRLDVVAVLEADGGVLAERAVVDLERRARLRQRLQRHELPAGRSRREAPRGDG